MSKDQLETKSDEFSELTPEIQKDVKLELKLEEQIMQD